MAYFRELATREKLTDGAMAAVGLGVDHLRLLLINRVVILCENSLNNTTISGDRKALATFIETLQKSSPDFFVIYVSIKLITLVSKV